jgi:hypothetical protein
MVLNLAVGAVTLAIGVFVTASPAQAAKIWGWKNLNQLDPDGRALYFRCYRVLGILLALAGALFAFEGIWLFH